MKRATMPIAAALRAAALVFTSSVVVAGCGRAPRAPRVPGPMASAVLAVSADLGSPPADVASAWRQLEALATRAEARHAGSGAPWIDDLNATVFGELGFEREIASGDPRFFRLPDVIAARRGSCLGLGALYLVLAERLGVGLDGVMVPGHFFVRTRETPSHNIELLRRGERMPDDWYRTKYGPWPQGDPLAFRPLTASGVASVFWFNAGNHRRAARDFDGAALAYRQALANLPEFAEAEASLGAVRQLQGALDEAAVAYDAVARRRPDLPGLAQNLALLERERERRNSSPNRGTPDAPERRAGGTAHERRESR